MGGLMGWWIDGWVDAMDGYISWMQWLVGMDGWVGRWMDHCTFTETLPSLKMYIYVWNDWTYSQIDTFQDAIHLCEQ